MLESAPNKLVRSEVSEDRQLVCFRRELEGNGILMFVVEYPSHGPLYGSEIAKSHDIFSSNLPLFSQAGF